MLQRDLLTRVKSMKLFVCCGSVLRVCLDHRSLLLWRSCFESSWCKQPLQYWLDFFLMREDAHVALLIPDPSQVSHLDQIYRRNVTKCVALKSILWEYDLITARVIYGGVYTHFSVSVCVYKLSNSPPCLFICTISLFLPSTFVMSLHHLPPQRTHI